MFRGSGRYRAPADSDDSPSSSSGEESLSDSPTPKAPFRHEHDSNESRKVTAVRDAFEIAYRSVASIKEPRYDIDQTGLRPWTDLGRALKTIVDNGSDTRVRAVLDVEAISVPLFIVLQRDLALMAKDKQYTRTLSKDEAKATYSVRRHWPSLCPQRLELTGPPLSTPKWLLLQLFRFSLDSQPIFTMGHLPKGSLGEEKQELQLISICSILKIPVHLVKGLDFEGQILRSLPIEFLTTFTQLEEIALDRSQIKWLPLLILKCPISRLQLWGFRPSIPEDTPRIRPSISLSSHPRPPRHRSLVQYSLIALLRTKILTTEVLELDVLPPIQELLAESYWCELCRELCAARSRDWLEGKQRLQWRAPVAGWVDLEGRICRSCLEYLTSLDEP